MLSIAGIVDDSITDGPGLRLAVFVQGCPHHCPGCHNPETWPFEGGTAWDEEAIYKKIAKNPMLSGVTFSGGEPFSQAAGLAALARHVRAAGLELAVYTGYTMEELMQSDDPGVGELLSLINILVDGRFEAGQRSLSLLFRGSANQRILDVPASLDAAQAVWTTDPRWLGENHG